MRCCMEALCQKIDLFYPYHLTGQPIIDFLTRRFTPIKLLEKIKARLERAFLWRLDLLNNSPFDLPMVYEYLVFLLQNAFAIVPRWVVYQMFSNKRSGKM